MEGVGRRILPDAALEWSRITDDHSDRWRREMMRQVFMLWRLYALVVIACWALLPWRTGWSGVGVSLWLTVWCTYARVMFWLAPKLRRVSHAQT